MAWMAANIYVRCDSAEEVADALAAILSEAEHQADLEGIEDPPGPLVVCPPLEGWVAVTGAGGWVDDLGWAAQRISAACATTAASGEIFGNCYRLRLAVHSEGQEQRSLRSPETEPDDDGPMPRYDDVEQLLYTALHELGVPPALVAVGTRPFEDRPLLEACPGITLLPGSDGVERGELQVQLPDVAAGDDAPVLPTRIGQDFGLMIFEDRYIEGVPNEAALTRLFELEQRYTERARRAYTGEAELSATFTYYAGPNQERLDVLLHSHDRHTLPAENRFRPPWWAFWRYFGKWR